MRELWLETVCYFMKKDVYKYTWVRKLEGGVRDKALMDYVFVSKRMRGRLLLLQMVDGAVRCSAAVACGGWCGVV